MIVELITAGGIGAKAEHLRLPVAQAVFRDEYGNPILLVAREGGGIQVVKTGDPGYERKFREYGLQVPQVGRISQPVPAGARLLQVPK